MTSIRTAGAALVLVALVVAGCGGSSTTASSPAGEAPASADAGNATTATEAPAEMTEAPAATTEAGGAGASLEDAANLGGQLIPPNSKEQSKTTTDTYWYVIYESTDSPDSLKGFYEGKIPSTGMKIVSTTSSGGTYSWAISRDETGSFGGAVTVAPSGSGSGSTVIIAVGS